MKTCSGCGRTLPLEAFSPTSPPSKQRRSRCKECRSRAYSLYQRTHREAVERTRRAWRAKRPTEVNKKDPRVRRAQSAVAHAVRSGRLVRPQACEVCGRAAKLVAHHDDYDKRLEVVWVCRSCHADKHGQRRWS